MAVVFLVVLMLVGFTGKCIAVAAFRITPATECTAFQWSDVEFWKCLLLEQIADFVSGAVP